MFVSSMEAQLSGIAKLILDISYIRVILYYGLIPAVMFFYVYLKVIRSSFDRKDGAVLAGLFFLAVYGVSERYMLDVYYQFPFLIAFRYLKKTEKNAKNPAKTSKNFAPDSKKSAPKRAQSTSKGHLRRRRAD